MAQGGWVDFRLLKKQVSIEQILKHYELLGSLIRKGDDALVGVCPIHRGHNANQFSISLTKNAWHCFGDCSKGGNVLDLVMRMEGLTDIRQAGLLMQEWFGIDSKSPGPQSEPRPPDKQEQEREEVQAQAEPIPPSEQVESQLTVRALKKEESTEQGERVNVPLKPPAFPLKNLDPHHPYLKERGFIYSLRSWVLSSLSLKGTATLRLSRGTFGK